MDFIKNLYSHFQNISDAETIPEGKMAQNSGIENTVAHRDVDIDSLLTSQSSGEISDIFTIEINSKNTDIRHSSQNNSENLQDIRETMDSENVKTNDVSNSSPESICIDFGSDIPPKNIEFDAPVSLLNLDNFEITFNNIVSDCESKEINALEEPLLNIDDFFDIFGSFDDVDKENGNNSNHINENITPENCNNEPLGVTDGELNMKTEYEIFLDEYEGIFKYLDNNDPERDDAVENTQSSINEKTIENTENLTSATVDVPIDFNITLTPIEIEHNSMSPNTTKHTNEIKLENMFINDFDFETNLEKSLISKNGVIHNVPQQMPRIEKANNNYIGLTNEKETLCELKDDKAHSIISILPSKTNYKSFKATENYAISISSAENVPNGNTYNDSDYCSGYNSSDFEFISENEAKEGLINDCYNKKLTTKRSSTVHTSEISKDKRYASGSSEYSSGLANSPGPRNHPNVYYNPGDTSYRQTHRMPDEQEYINLFQIYAPLEMLFLENKSLSCMNVPLKQLCLDMGGDSNDDSDYEFKDEAEESIKKIRSMYPGEIREGSRRF